MAVTPKQEYATLRHVFLKIYCHEGILAFYRGYIPSIAGVIPYAGVSFFTYDTLKRLYRGVCSNESEISTSMMMIKFAEHVDISHIPPPIASLGFGAVAGMLGQTSSYPLDIVRRRMQTDTTGQYKTIIGTFKIIYWFVDFVIIYLFLLKINCYYSEGIIRGFYKGLSMNWIKGPIAVGISYATYDNIKDLLRTLASKWHRDNL